MVTDGFPVGFLWVAWQTPTLTARNESLPWTARRPPTIVDIEPWVVRGDRTDADVQTLRQVGRGTLAAVPRGDLGEALDEGDVLVRT